MAGKIKLDTEAIREFLIANTESESCSEDSDFEESFEEEEEEEVKQQQQQHQQQVSANIKTQAATSGRLPIWGPPQGRNTFILLSVQQKV
jgi:hypothetical protein